MPKIIIDSFKCRVDDCLYSNDKHECLKEELHINVEKGKDECVICDSFISNKHYYYSMLENEITNKLACGVPNFLLKKLDIDKEHLERIKEIVWNKLMTIWSFDPAYQPYLPYFIDEAEKELGSLEIKINN